MEIVDGRVILPDLFNQEITKNYTVLDGSVKSSIDKIKPNNYENYFIYAYNKDYYKNTQKEKH